MADEVVLRPQEIPEQPFPGEGEEVVPGGEASAGEGVESPNRISNKGFPQKRVAVELISVTLNTRSKKILAEYQFTESGAIQIGKFVVGVSGDIRISPGGIVARDKAGNVTFSLEGDEGSAVFKGEVKAGSLVSGEVIVGNNNVVIDGANRRIVVNDGTNDRIVLGYQSEGF